MPSTSAKKYRRWEKLKPTAPSESGEPAGVEGVVYVKQHNRAKTRNRRRLRLGMDKKSGSLAFGLLFIHNLKHSTSDTPYMSFDLARVTVHFRPKRAKFLLEQQAIQTYLKVRRRDFETWKKALAEHAHYRLRHVKDLDEKTGIVTGKSDSSEDEEPKKVAAGSVVKEEVKQKAEVPVETQTPITTAANVVVADSKLEEAELKMALVNSRLPEVKLLRQKLQSPSTMNQARLRESSLMFQLALNEVVDVQKALGDVLESIKQTMDAVRGPREAKTPAPQKQGDALLMEQMKLLMSGIKQKQDLSDSDESDDEESGSRSDEEETSISTTCANTSTSEDTTTYPPAASLKEFATVDTVEAPIPEKPPPKKTVEEKSPEPVRSKEDVRPTAAVHKRLALPMRRRSLPATAPPPVSISLKTIFNRSLTLPIGIFEPVSMLQIGGEELRFADLLDKAAKASDVASRMAYIMAFTVTPYGNTVNRARKPFNPLLFETYEFDRQKQLGWRVFAEQVSHHPDITASHAEGNGWVLWQTGRFTLHPGFSGVEIRPDPDFNTKLLLRPFDETYTWTKVTSVLQNVLKPAERRVTHYGHTEIKCSSGIRATVSFDKWSKSHDRRVTGCVLKGSILLATIEGQWAGDIYRIKQRNRVPIFKSPSFSTENLPKFYGFSPFTMELNELTDDIKPRLPPTDTRFRPDQRCLEEGKLEEAQKMKGQLEEKQRTRKQRQDKQLEPTRQPLWFVPDQSSTGVKKCWVSNGKYWTAKENGFKGIDFCPLW